MFSLCWVANARGGAPSAKLVRAEIDRASLHPGDAATVTVTVAISEGLHAQSHTPSERFYIPFIATLAPAPGMTVGEVQYPAGEDKTYPQLGKLNVYVGQVSVKIPLTVTRDAADGPLDLNGKIRLQACNDKACFPPETIGFSVECSIAGGAAPSTTAPAAMPTTLAAAVPSAPIAPVVFGVDLAPGGLPLALLAAFVIGIIFNAMPCVLPVMPLKIMGFYEASQHDRGKSLRLGFVFSAGLVSFFLILATFIVGLHELAWGDLFKQTWFTILIVLVLAAMALGTFGVFNVLLPSRVYAFSPRHDTYSGNFLFGVFTAMLSTPCTFGAFVALLTWTLTQSTWVGFALFASVGCGMAFPYLLLSGFPTLARRFPRTGPWSEVVKQMMAFLLLATAVFFAQPLISRFLTASVTWWIIFSVIAAASLFLIVRAIQLSAGWTGRVVAAVIALAMVTPSFALVRRLTSQPYRWQPYSQAALDEARATNRPVVIDFTADWCGNCHWLEATVLHDPKVVAAVRAGDVLMLQADVTYPDAPGQPLLAQLNPAGTIPVAAIYKPGEAQPRVLLDIYSVKDLLRLLSSG